MNPGTPSKSRWVGFDVDECLGSFMPLWPYVDFLAERIPKDKKETLLDEIVKRISDANAAGRIWIFRPGLDALLMDLFTAFQKHQITGCFLLSNNASKSLIEAVRRMLNYRIRKLTGQESNMFVTGWHRSAPSRRGDETKNFTLIQRSLHHAKLPKLLNRTDLLFFDDIDHVLQGEIQHYVKVPPYVFVTPHMNVFRVLQSLFTEQEVPKHLLDEAIKQGDLFEQQDHKDRFYKFVSPPGNLDTSHFRKGFQAFLRGTLSDSKTRRISPKKRKQTRKSLWKRY
jgi:hypothetical protein